jgi:hypothetical protein
MQKENTRHIHKFIFVVSIAELDDQQWPIGCVLKTPWRSESGGRGGTEGGGDGGLYFLITNTKLPTG